MVKLKIEIMKIMKIYKWETNAEWFEVDEKDVIRSCEGGGYWKKVESIDVLIKSGRIWTPYATWQIDKEVSHA